MTSFTFYFGAAILAIFMVEATSYVIGGGVNTDFGSVENQPNWLQSALSSARNYRRNHRQHKKPKKSRIAFPGLVHTETWTSFDSVRSPFLRNKRQAQCALPSDLPQMVMALNRDLDVPQFLGLTRQGTGYTPLPLDQPAKNDCPRPTGSWWPRQATNLKSTCPWVMEEKDLGEEYFPRYVREAVCLCRTCVGANSMGCQVVRQPVTVFKHGECRDGLAVMTKQVFSISTGCYCASGATPETDPSMAKVATDR